MAITQTQRRQHCIKHSAGMQFQILLQGQNIWVIQLLGKSWDANFSTWAPPKSSSKEMAA